MHLSLGSFGQSPDRLPPKTGILGRESARIHPSEPARALRFTDAFRTPVEIVGVRGVFVFVSEIRIAFGHAAVRSGLKRSRTARTFAGVRAKSAHNGTYCPGPRLSKPATSDTGGLADRPRHTSVTATAAPGTTPAGGRASTVRGSRRSEASPPRAHAAARTHPQDRTGVPAVPG